MTMRHAICKLFSLITALTLIVSALPGPALAEEAATERQFAQLVQAAFPDEKVDSALDNDGALTCARALHTLCPLVQLAGGSDADNLAFAIEHDLMPGIACTAYDTLSLAQVRTLTDSFAAYLNELLTSASNELMAGNVAQTRYFSSAMTGAVHVSEAADGAMLYNGSIDYNGLDDETYGHTQENGWRNPVDSPFSTFGLDVDTASYANLRRYLLNGELPPADAVRIEEMLNYFQYDLPALPEGEPVGVTAELAVCPWNASHQLAMIALQGYEPEALPDSSLVFLVDVSGSMEQENRLPLARKAMKLLAEQLGENDRIAIVTYAGTVGTLLESTACDDKETIRAAIDSMTAGGATNGAGGIQAAYDIARANFIEGGNNRVILMTDGDFNVGAHSAAQLQALIESERDSGVYLSVLGFGMGNLKDYEMETLADHGNGTYAYIDTYKEAQKVLLEDMRATLYAIAKDVKLQVEFNPAKVAGYRLIGYENRLLNTEDFTDDTKDAGELGAGSQMVALYEIIPTVEGAAAQGTVSSRYQAGTVITSDETLYAALRYQLPDSGEIRQSGAAVSEISQTMSESLTFASAVAELGLLLSNSDYKADANMESLLARAKASRGADENGYRAELVQVAGLAELLMK